MSLDPLSTAVHPFDAATAVARTPDGRLRGRTSADYWAFVGPFGGFTAATLLRAVTADREAAGEPVALTVNYCAPIAEGGFDLDVRLVRANRSSQHWTVALTQDGTPTAIATVMLAERRASWSHQPAAPPEAPPSSALPLYDGPSTAPWVGQYAFRFVEGAPSFDGEGGGEVRSVVWMSDTEPRPLDHLSLASMGDAFFARIFQAKRALVPFGTVTMTTYFHASAEELAAEAATEVLGVAEAQTFHRSYGDQLGELWSAAGQLLATTHQLCYFKA